MLQHVAACSSVLQHAAVCCSVLQRVAVATCQAASIEVDPPATANNCNTLQHTATHCSELLLVELLMLKGTVIVYAILFFLDFWSFVWGF